MDVLLYKTPKQSNLPKKDFLIKFIVWQFQYNSYIIVFYKSLNVTKADKTGEISFIEQNKILAHLIQCCFSSNLEIESDMILRNHDQSYVILESLYIQVVPSDVISFKPLQN